MQIQRVREIYFKELAHGIVGTGKSGIGMASQQSGNPGRILCCNLEAELLFQEI
jgi:hypothetical protein